jgi:hypothetical protein
MPINIIIPDTDLNGFNQPAQNELKKSIQDFSNDLLAECNRIEASANTTSNVPEITSSIVADARVLLRHKISKPKKSSWKVWLKIAASLVTLLSGIMYQKEKLQDTSYLIFYIIVIALAIILTTLTILKED